MKILPLLLVLIALIGSRTVTHAQAYHTSHVTFALDSVEAIQLQLVDNYAVEEWAGSQIMLQTTVKLYGAKDNLLQHFVEKGRYDLRDTLQGRQLQIISKETQRPKIKASEGECYEVVELRVYVPAEFAQIGDHQWQRKSEPE